MENSKNPEQEAKEESDKILGNKNLTYYWMGERGNVWQVSDKQYLSMMKDNMAVLNREMSYFGQDFIIGSDVLYYSEFQEKLDKWLKIK